MDLANHLGLCPRAEGVQEDKTYDATDSQPVVPPIQVLDATLDLEIRSLVAAAEILPPASSSSTIPASSTRAVEEAIKKIDRGVDPGDIRDGGLGIRMKKL